MKALIALIIALSPQAQAKVALAVGALAAHYSGQPTAFLMPDKISLDGKYVRLNSYLSISSEEGEQGSKRLIALSVFKNCYQSPSLAFSYARQAGSAGGFDFYWQGSLYLRERPIAPEDLYFYDSFLDYIPKGQVIRDMPRYEADFFSERYGVSLLPALLITYPINNHIRLDISLSAISIIQISLSP